MSQGTVVVSIGRNIGNKPMTDTQWDAFKRATREALSRASSIMFFEGEGYGQLPDRTTEESYTLIASPKRTSSVLSLMDTLEDIAGLWKQDAIAVTVGKTHFAGPNTKTY